MQRLLVAALLLVAARLSGEPCAPSPTKLCLNAERFAVEVSWKDFAGNTGFGQAVPLTSDTGYFWFFSSNNVELVVKVLDASAFNGRFWVFYGALSNVEYTLTVTDSITGRVKTYNNPSGSFGSVGDTDAFPASTPGAATSSAGKPRETFGLGGMSGIPAALPETARAAAPCPEDPTSLYLSGCRFRVSVSWKDFAGNTGSGQPVPLTSDTGYFWFFSSNNVELVVKVLDARTFNGRFWVFYGALSNVEYAITVTDTLTGNVNTYSNPSGRFASAGDTEGFRAGYSVAAQLDQVRAVSRLIPTEGGTLSATAADGTLFTLTIPDGALLSEEEITMTPVAAVDRLPLGGGLAAAVQLAPEGLRLFKPATLVINLPAPIPVDEEITFAWRGTGEEFILYPPDPLETPAISLSLIHFSGYGAGRGSSDDEDAQQARLPANVEDQHKQRLNRPASRQRRERRSGRTPGQALVDAAIKELTDYFLKVLGPLQPTTCSDDWKGFLSKLKAFEASVNDLTGGDPALLRAAQNYYESLYGLLVRCYDMAYERCKSDKDPSQGEEMARIWGALISNGQEHRVDTGKIGKCLTFELTFNSLIIEKQAPGASFAFRHHVEAIVPLISPVSSFGNPGPVSAELKYLIADYIGEYGDSSCTFTTRGGSSVFSVLKLSIDINIFEGNGAPPNLLTMKYDPGSPDFTFTITCPRVPVQTLTAPRWREIYWAHRDAAEKGEPTDPFFAKDWTKPGGGDPYALKFYGRASIAGTETTTMKLKHTPQ